MLTEVADGGILVTENGLGARTLRLLSPTGSLKWKTDLVSEFGSPPNNFVVSVDHVYVPLDKSPVLLGFRIGDGELVLRAQLPARGRVSFCWQDAIYVLVDGRVQKFCESSGDHLGTFETPSGTVPGKPQVQPGRLTVALVSKAGSVMAHYDIDVNAGAEPVWQEPIPERGITPPVTVGKSLVFLSERGLITTLDSETGETLGSFIHKRVPKCSGWLIHEGDSLLVAQGGRVTCYEAKI